VLPNTFHKGLSSSAPMVSVQAPETGSIGAPSPHKSVTFNKTSMPATAEELQKRMKELEEMKSQAEAAIKQSEAAAAANKKDENKAVAVSS